MATAHPGFVHAQCLHRVSPLGTTSFRFQFSLLENLWLTFLSCVSLRFYTPPANNFLVTTYNYPYWTKLKFGLQLNHTRSILSSLLSWDFFHPKIYHSITIFDIVPSHQFTDTNIWYCAKPSTYRYQHLILCKIINSQIPTFDIVPSHQFTDMLISVFRNISLSWYCN